MRFLVITALVFASLALAGCKKPVNPNDLPMSYWADPKNNHDIYGSDECSIATAQAIVKSGLPYPNFQGAETTGADGKKETRVKTVDVWVGPTRFVLPSKVVSRNDAYADKHPMRFWKLRGNLPNFYPVGEPVPVVDGMGSMVDITISCSVDPKYTATWGKGYRSNEEGIAKVKAQYEKQLKDNPNLPGTVTTSIREDLGMTEVLMDRFQEANGRRFWEASYWPLKEELKSPDGGVSGIACQTRNDPQKRYGNRGWRCSSAIGLAPHATANIDIYVSQIQHMPAIYAQISQLFQNSKQP